MRAATCAAALVLAALLTSSVGHADPTGSYLYVVPFGGYTMFDGTLRAPTATLQDQYDLGGRLGLQWQDWLGLEIAGGFTPSEEELPGGQKVSFWHGSGRAVLSPFPSRYGSPFLLLGGGTSTLSPKVGETRNEGTVEVGAGLNLWVSDAIGLRVEGRDLLWLSEGSFTKIQNHTLTFGGGITYAIGGAARDTDRDGVPDSRDECVATPIGAEVNAQGCPVDRDQDLVFDGLDQCPETPAGATVDARGCPSDPDGDGIFDGIDQCADTPEGATVNAEGCPSDGDGDGVLDGIDQCAATPQGAKVDARGCPTDADSDGVFDGIDQCDDTLPGFAVNAEGCVEEIVEFETAFVSTGKFVIPNLLFASSKSDILPEAERSLDLVGGFLFRWPGLVLEIGGHTDSSGDPTANQRLSDARAQAVRDYLLAKYPTLDPELVTVKGYGPARPVADNTTPEGRAQNRRVEVKAADAGALQQEIQKRIRERQPQQKEDGGN